MSGTQSSKVMFLIVASVVSSVALIMVNKAIMRNYGFRFVLALTSCHFVATYIILSFMARMGAFEIKRMPPLENWFVAAAGVGSIAFMNFNLEANSVGFYQVTKLLCIPCIVAIQMYHGVSFSARIKLSLLVVLLGVGLATITDVELNTRGTLYGLLAVLCTSQFQIWQGEKQRKHKLDALQCTHTLALNQAVLTATMSLLLEGTSEPSLWSHAYSSAEVALILLSCVLAISVNLCSFGLIGKTSAVTYQVVGHAKTCLILLFGFLLYPVNASSGQLLRNLMGILVALVGVVAYGHIKVQESSAKAVPLPTKELHERK